MARERREEQPEEPVVRAAPVVVKADAAVVAERHRTARAQQLAADGLHLQPYLVGLPDVVLVANGNVVARGKGHCAEEVGVDAPSALVYTRLYDAVTCSIFLHDGHGAVGGHGRAPGIVGVGHHLGAAGIDKTGDIALGVSAGIQMSTL